jgi:ubiquinone/menaquinone biosynthesis C-methylase UbiE
MVTDRRVPNHHAGQGHFEGPIGFLLGLAMALIGGANARVAAQAAGVGPEDRLVDVGCGPGTAARLAASRGATVVGVDPASMMRRIAGWLSPAALPIRWLDGLAERLPVETGWATVVWSILSVHHWPELPGGIAEARRVLAPGGRFVVVEKRTQAGATGLASHGWTPEQAQDFAQMLRDAGFASAEVSEVPAGRGTAMVVVARTS